MIVCVCTGLSFQVWNTRKVQEYEDAPELWVDTDIRWSKDQVLRVSSKDGTQVGMGGQPVAADDVAIHLK